GKTFLEAGSIIGIAIDAADVIDLEVQLKNRRKDETNIKLEIARLAKIKLDFPGIRISFTDSNFKLNDEKSIIYVSMISGEGGVGNSKVKAELVVAIIRLVIKVGVSDTDVYGSSIPSIFKLPIEPLDTSEDEELIPARTLEDMQVISPEFVMPLD